MIRVLHVLDELRRSGVELQILRASPGWRERGIETSVVATGAAVGSNQRAFADANIAVHHIPYRKRPGFLLELSRLARGHDIVQTHTERAFIYCVLSCRAAGAHVVHSPCTVIRIGGAWRWRRVAQRWVARAAGVRMVSTSDSVADNEREWFRNSTQLIRNYIATADFLPYPEAETRARLAVPTSTPLLITVGNCLPSKNHAALLHALAGVEGPWHLLHVGQEFDGQERALACDLGLEKRCSFLGARDDVANLLRAADVFVMPSLAEGLGNAALEAASAGLILVLSDVTGLRDLRHVAELAVWTGTDPTSIADGLRRGLNLIPTVTSAGRRRQHHALAGLYGLQRGIDEYATLYYELAGVP